MWNSWIDQLQKTIDEAADALSGDMVHAANEQGVTKHSQEPCIGSSDSVTEADVAAGSDDGAHAVNVGSSKETPILDAIGVQEPQTERYSARSSDTILMRADSVNVIPVAPTTCTTLTPVNSCMSVQKEHVKPVALPRSSVAGELNTPLEADVVHEIGVRVEACSDNLMPTSNVAPLPAGGTGEAVTLHSSPPFLEQVPHLQNASCVSLLSDSVRADNPPELAPQSCNSTLSLAEESHLIRFQRQLAEEMQTSAWLSERNTSLQNQVAALEHELAEAQSRSSAAANRDSEISSLIDRLGQEKERRKVVSDERRVLREKVDVLEKRLADYVNKETVLTQSHQTLQAAKKANGERIDQLELELKGYHSRVTDLTEKLQGVTTERNTLAAELLDVQRNYQSAMAKVEKCRTNTQTRLQEEIERLQETLRRASEEGDERTRELEQELSLANMRAHQAEMRLSDVERRSVESLRDMRSELEDTQRRASLLATELTSVKREYDALHEKYSTLNRRHSVEDATQPEVVVTPPVTASVAMVQKNALQEDNSSVQRKLQKALQEVEAARSRVMILESTNAQLKSALEKARFSAQLDGSGSPDRSAGMPHSFADPIPHGLRVPIGAKALFSEQSGQPFSTDGSQHRTRERIERELIRQTAEVERLRKVETAMKEQTQKMSELGFQHDLLLQMYGQLEEELRELRGTSQVKQQMSVT